MLEGVTERDTCIDAIDPEDSRVGGRGENPSVFSSSFFEVFQADASSIYPDRLWERFGESIKKGLESVRIIRKKCLAKIFDETVVYLGSIILFRHTGQ